MINSARTPYKGIIHLHSRSSYDSWVSVRTITEIALAEKLDFILLTDHDTIEGSLRLRDYVQSRKLNIQIPIAAEYKTDHGDVIAAFVEEEIKETRFQPFVAEVRERGGLTMLPHPFAHHSDVDELARACDLIETYNARISGDLNANAERLAQKYKKPTFSGSDAHLSKNIGNVILRIENAGDLKTSLLNGLISATVRRETKKDDLIISQIIKGVKKRDFKLISYNIIRFIYWLLCRD